MKLLKRLFSKRIKRAKVFETKANQLIESDPTEEDFYTEDGYLVFTQKYHEKRGYCCESGCRHCPF
jgi:hypothetical protein